LLSLLALLLRLSADSNERFWQRPAVASQ
jgi:hypothetical protein